MLVLVFTTCNPRREKMQEKEKDTLEGTRIEVIYYRKNAINPPISSFEGTLEQFLMLPRIEPYGKILARSRVNDNEAIVEVRTSSNRRRKLIAKEIQRAIE